MTEADAKRWNQLESTSKREVEVTRKFKDKIVVSLLGLDEYYKITLPTYSQVITAINSFKETVELIKY